MHTTMLWTSGVFSTTVMCSPWLPSKPNSAMAALALRNSRTLNSRSIQARATTRAPLCGPIRVS